MRNSAQDPPTPEIVAQPPGSDEEEPIDLTKILDPPEGPGEIGRLAQYRVLGILGRGGMGMVLRAEDTELLRLVAVKIMRPQIARKPESRERFLREARGAAQIRHAHVVTIYQTGEHGGLPFIVMECLEGISLQQHLERQRQLPLGEVVRIGREIAEGLQAAHARGLIHRDIKPANIWLEAPYGRVKILDFGLVREEHTDLKLTQTGAVIGTPMFMSPEQACGEAVDHRSDLFSLGTLLYRICSGSQPFAGNTLTSLVVALCTEDPRPIRELCPDIPVELEQLITGLLEKEVGKRIQSAGAVVAALANLSEIDEPSDIKPASPSIDFRTSTIDESEPAYLAKAKAARAGAAKPAQAPGRPSSGTVLEHFPTSRRGPYLAVAIMALVIAGLAAVVIALLPAQQTPNTNGDSSREEPIAQATPQSQPDVQPKSASSEPTPTPDPLPMFTPEPDVDLALETEIDRVAAKFAERLARPDLKQKKVAIAEIVGPADTPGHSGPLLQKLFHAAFRKRNISVNHDADLSVSGQYYKFTQPMLERENEIKDRAPDIVKKRVLSVRYVFQLKTNGGTVKEEDEAWTTNTKILVDILSPSAYSRDPTKFAAEQNRHLFDTLVRQTKRNDPPWVIDGTRVHSLPLNDNDPLTQAADGGRPFAVEIVKAGKGLDPFVERNHLFVDLKRGDVFGIRVYNDHPKLEAAVEILLDGISIFEFSDERKETPDAPGETVPKFGYYFLSPNASATFTGWHKNTGAVLPFVVTGFPDSAAGKYKASSLTGTIEAKFHLSWDGKEPLREEAGSRDDAVLGFGPFTELRSKAVNRTIGGVRDIIAIRYKR